MAVEIKNKNNNDSITTFVNFGNYNLPIGGKSAFLYFAVEFFFIVDILYCFILDNDRMFAIGVAFGMNAVFVLAEVYVHHQLKRTRHPKWVLLPINIASTFWAICFLHISEVVLHSLSAPILLQIGGILIFTLSFAITNYLMIRNVKNGKYKNLQNKWVFRTDLDTVSAVVVQ